MAVLLCRCCGARLEIKQGASIVKCGYCGVQQTVPILGFDEEALLWERAEELRRSGEYDRAMSLYEQIAALCPDEPDVYWSKVLCRYGVEYVEEAESHRRIPTINRIQYTSVIDDEDYRKAVRLALNGDQRRIYILEAQSLDSLRGKILSVSLHEQPYDIFICYKESDRNGRRTEDSALAAGLYRALCAEGWRVFFSRITLEDKAGTEFEPYIFAALNSAKIMLVVGTSPENINAVWVKNEWSRYLARMTEKGEGTLVPLYKGMLKEHLPAEFNHFYAIDMSEPGFEDELIRGIRKVITKTHTPKLETRSHEPTDTSGMLRRAELYLEDCDFKRADEICEKILDREPENARAYLIELLAEYHITAPDKLHEYVGEDFSTSVNYARVMRFGDEPLKSWLENEYALARAECARISEENIKVRNEQEYERAKQLIETAESKSELLEARSLLTGKDGYKDCAEIYKRCNSLIQSFEQREEFEKSNNRSGAEKSAFDKRRKKQVRGRILAITLAAILVVSFNVIRAAKYASRANSIQLANESAQGFVPYQAMSDDSYIAKRYDAAVEMYDRGDYSGAADIFDKLWDYKDSRRYALLSKYNCAEKLADSGKYSLAAEKYLELGNFSDSPERAKACRYMEAKELFQKGKYENAMKIFGELESYMDSDELYAQAKYNYAVQLRDAGNYNEAITAFTELGDYSDAEAQIIETINLRRADSSKASD